MTPNKSLPIYHDSSLVFSYPSPESATHSGFEVKHLKLSIQKVPRQLAIAPDRFYLAVDYDGDRHYYPIQLTRQEVCQLIEQAQGLTLPRGVA